MTHSVHRSVCPSAQIPKYLGDSLSPAETAAFELHLESCQACQNQLADGAAANEIWVEASKLLASDDFDTESTSRHSSRPSISLEPLAQLDDRSTLEFQRLLREVSGWLDPTDDPRMLGRFGGYEIAGIIGHGGMGIVLKGLEVALDRYVAIKILAPRLASSSIARERFAREARAAAAVLHPNVIAIHRVDEHHGLPFLVMPYLAGETLQQRIDREGSLDCAAALRVGSQLAAGLFAAHSKGTVHRDVKPANILLNPGVDRVTITDFGLARAADDASVTRTGILPGTPPYMSPEQAMGLPVDARSDLFSLGSVMHAMATGTPPFQGESIQQIIAQVCQADPKPLKTDSASFPDWYSLLIDLLMTKRPEDRAKDGAQVQSIIEACLRHIEDTTQPLPKELCRPNAPRSHRYIGTITTLMVFTLIACVTMVIHPRWTSDAPATNSATTSNSKEIPDDPADEMHTIYADLESIESEIDAIKGAVDEFDLQ